VVERALEVGEGDVGVDAEAFDLVEDGRVGGVGGVVAVDLAGDDDAQRRRLLLDHGADLHGRGVGAHEQAVAEGLRSWPAMTRVSWVSRAGWLGGKLRASKL
jgi:hypothetical protein